MIYEITSSRMKRVDVPENHQKNNLPIGTVLHLNGYNDPDFVIVKNLGINEKFSWGTRYLVISLMDLGQSYKDAYLLKYISEKRDDRIQTYITDKILSPDEVLELWEKSEAKRKRMEEAQAKAKAGADKLEARGKELFGKYIPENAKALIVACYDVNDSDIQTDYFAHTVKEKVILGYSFHTRDLFSEMRKYAGKIPETRHLVNAPKEAEHREKWSMGDGYYLKDGHRHSTGWRVEKETYNIRSRENYICLAKRCIFNDHKAD
jgi:hypothetical protein